MNGGRRVVCNNTFRGATIHGAEIKAKKSVAESRP